MAEQFTYEPCGEQSARESRFVGPFERIGAPQLSEPVLHIIALIDALCPDDLRTLSGYIHSKRFPVSHSAHPLAGMVHPCPIASIAMRKATRQTATTR